MFDLNETDATKQVSLHDIGLSSISSQNETEYYSYITDDQKNSFSIEKKKEKNWFETCLEIRELALQVLTHVEEVPVHSRDQKSFLKQIIFSLVSKILFGSNQKNKEESQFEEKYNDLQKQYETAIARIKILENQISILENQKEPEIHHEKPEIKHQKSHKTSNKEKYKEKITDNQINSSIQQIAKLVKKQTKNQKKLIEAVVSHDRQKRPLANTYFNKNDEFLNSHTKHKQKEKKNYKNDEISSINDLELQMNKHKKSRNKTSDQIIMERKNIDKDFLNHINELVGKTNDIQNHLFDVTGKEDLSLSKLSMLNESLLIAERKFKQNINKSDDDYSSS